MEDAALSSLAGINKAATSATALARSLYQISSALRSPPRELSSTAGRLADLSTSLHHLRSVLLSGTELCKPRLAADVAQILLRIQAAHDDIRHMVEESTRLARLKRIWKGSKVKEILVRIRGYQNVINLIANVVLVAAYEQHQRDEQNTAPNRFRDLSEIFVQSSRHSILQIRKETLHAVSIIGDLDGRSSRPDDRVGEWGARPLHSGLVPAPVRQRIGTDDQRHVAAAEAAPSNDGMPKWSRPKESDSDCLYRLVFAGAVEAKSPVDAEDDGGDDEESESEATSTLARRGSLSLRKPLRRDTRNAEYTFASPPAVVDHLLAQWSQLSEDQIVNSKAFGKADAKNNDHGERQWARVLQENLEKLQDEEEKEKETLQRSSAFAHRGNSLDTYYNSPSSASESELPPRKPSAFQIHPKHFSSSSAHTTQPLAQRHPPLAHSQSPSIPTISLTRTSSIPLTPPARTDTDKWNEQRLSLEKQGTVAYRQPSLILLPPVDDSTGSTTSPSQLAATGTHSSDSEGKESGDGSGGLRIVRVPPNIWSSTGPDCDELRKRCGLHGGAVLGTLMLEPSAFVHSSELRETLLMGSWGVLYLRGSDAGETWFYNRNAFFVNFFNANYKPQFHPASKTSTTSHNRNEYVSIGEEWVELEALKQMGIIPKGKLRGRLVLDASLSWPEIERIVAASFYLRDLNLRRLYKPYFFKPMSGGDDKPTAVSTIKPAIHPILKKKNEDHATAAPRKGPEIVDPPSLSIHPPQESTQAFPSFSENDQHSHTFTSPSDSDSPRSTYLSPTTATAPQFRPRSNTASGSERRDRRPRDQDAHAAGTGLSRNRVSRAKSDVSEAAAHRARSRHERKGSPSAGRYGHESGGERRARRAAEGSDRDGRERGHISDRGDHGHRRKRRESSRNPQAAGSKKNWFGNLL